MNWWAQKHEALNIMCGAKVMSSRYSGGSTSNFSDPVWGSRVGTAIWKVNKWLRTDLEGDNWLLKLSPGNFQQVCGLSSTLEIDLSRVIPIQSNKLLRIKHRWSNGLTYFARFYEFLNGIGLTASCLGTMGDPDVAVFVWWGWPCY